ncbi:ATP-dependent RNA helicase DEAH12, chloroplastic-like isoform X2 [Pyrus communis]
MAQENSSASDDLHLNVDDFYFSALFDDETYDESEPVSDSKYAQELQFQEALMSSSAVTSQSTHNDGSSSSSSSATIQATQAIQSNPIHEILFPIQDTQESGESSSPQPSTQILCGICFEMKEADEMFRNEGCVHSFCSDCITKHVASKIQANIHVVSCPSLDCRAVLELDACMPMLPKEVIERWNDALCEAMVLGAPQPSTQILCGICFEMKEADEMFRNEGCVHSFCSDCITKHVASKIQANIHVVSCPSLDCRAVLELDACMPMLPKEVIERWNDALCEAMVLGAQRLYCPFRDCSTVLMIDNEGEEATRESECPICHRLFCARCQIPWHPGVDCEEFQRLNESERGRADLMVKELAKQKKWKRCPRCKYYVEKTQGCLHITCRCQYHFCYACGAEWTSTHGGCQ